MTDITEEKLSTLRCIRKVGVNLNAKQQTISVSMMIYHRYLLTNNKCDNEIVICVMSLLLGHKITDVHVGIKEILVEAERFFIKNRVNSKTIFKLGCSNDKYDVIAREIQNQELIFCINTGFGFDYTDYYSYLESKHMDLELNDTIRDISRIILNDSFYLPLFIRFTKKCIIISILHLALMIYFNCVPERMDNEVLSYIDGCRSKDPDINITVDLILDFYIKQSN